MMKIMGIDPGLRHTGWGVILSDGNALFHVAHGVVHSCASQVVSFRLKELFVALKDVLDQNDPQEVAVEETFVNKNPSSTLKLGLARGIALVIPALRHVPVFEYSANKIKKSVVGSGHADKNQVAHMVRTLLPKAGEVKLDAADALAIAICHANHRTHFSQRLP